MTAIAPATPPAAPAAPVLAGSNPPQHRLPFLKYLKAVRTNFIEGLDEGMYREKIIRQQTIGPASFIVNDPTGIRRVLLENAANYPKAAVEHRILGPGLGNGLILSEGETWRAHRRTMAPAFDARIVEQYSPVMADAAQKLGDQWQALAPGSTIEISSVMMGLTLEIISRSMFAADSDSIVGLVREGSDGYQKVMMPGLLEFVPGLGLIWSSLKSMFGRAALKQVDRAVFRLIAARQNGSMEPSKPDLLDRLIAARDEQTGKGMTAGEIRDQILTIFVAGHETTALALMWTWYLLSLHPQHEARLHAELDRVLAGRPPHWADVPKLTYTRMVLQESMRLYPPAHTMAFREAQADDVICGMKVPKGSTVTIIPWLVHRHRGLWQEPERFDPERFTAQASAGRERLAYIPFGFGPRVCIGASFAMTEEVMILATLAQRFRLRLAQTHPVEPLARFTLTVKNGMKMEVMPRG
jgi:cytochrome P450